MVQFFSLGPKTCAVTFCRFGKANVPIFHFMMFFLLRRAGCSRSHFTNDQTKVNLAFSLFLVFSRALMRCGCSEQIYSCMGGLCELSLSALQKHFRSVSIWNGRGHLRPPSLWRVNMSVSLWCDAKLRVKSHLPADNFKGGAVNQLQSKTSTVWIEENVSTSLYRKF